MFVNTVGTKCAQSVNELYFFSFATIIAAVEELKWQETGLNKSILRKIGRASCRERV